MHYRGSSSTNTGVKSEGNSLVEIPPRTLFHHVQIAKVRATITKKQEHMILSCVSVMKSRI